MTIVALVVGLVITTAVAGAQLNDGGRRGVLLLTAADGTTQPLDGATVAGPVYVSLDSTVDASEVRFYIGPERQSPFYRGSDFSAPFNLVENDRGEAQPFDVASLGAGEHLFWATYNDHGAWRHVRHAVTVVEVSPASADEPVAGTPRLEPAANEEDLAGAGVLVVTDASGTTIPLDGATLSGKVSVYFDPGLSVRVVRFYLGSERNQYTYVGADYDAPFTFAEAAGHTLDASSLAAGDHVMWATYNQDGAWRHVGHYFSVAGDGTTVPKRRSAEPTVVPSPTPESVTSAPSLPGPTAAPTVPAPTAKPIPFTLNLLPEGSGVLLATDSSGKTVRLDGARLSGSVRIWLDPRVNALEVRFYIGKQRLSENLRSIDYSAPFNLAEVEGRSVSVPAGWLGGVIFATYNDDGAWRHVRHDFSVADDASGARVVPTPKPTPKPTPRPAPTPTATPTPKPPPKTSPTATPVPGGGSNGGPEVPQADVQAGDIVVAPGATGAGTLGDPASLRTTLASRSIAPGTTVWLRGGTYAGELESWSDGTQANPIVIRSYPGEKAVIDGNTARSSTPTVSIEGDWQTWTDLEFTNSSTSRTLGISGSVGRPTLLHILGRGTAVINNSIHDGGVCVGWWKSAYDSVVYGNLIYNCGWDGPDRPHGHALYIQNLDNGRKLLEQNLVSSTYGRSLLIYGSAQVHNIDVYGNVFAGGHSLGEEAKSPVYLSGAVEDLNFVGNHVYTLEKEPVSFVDGGTTMRFDNNYLMTTTNSLAGIWVRNSRHVTGSGNHIVSNNVQIRLEATGGFDRWDDNTYYGPDNYYPGIGLADWRSRTGLDANSTNRSDLPNHVVVASNRYDGDRGLVTIWNGSRAASVAVDVSEVLEVGDSYAVYGGQDLGGAPVLSGTYSGGTLSFPMAQRSVGAAIGGPSPAAWGSEFGTFVILPGS